MRLPIVGIAVLAASLGAQAQMQDNQERRLNCDQQSDRQGGRSALHCEIKEQMMPASGRIVVDGGQNGGVSVKGWLRNDVLIRSKIQTGAPTFGEARDLSQQINISAAGGQIVASGPQSGNDRSWSVSYEIFVPQHTDLSLKAHNGGVSISDIRGVIDFDAVNGGASLKRLAGTVRGKTVNGGLNVELMGDRWDGTDFDTTTTNGGVNMVVPANYSARLETATVNGHINVDFPVTVSGKIDRNLSLNLGNGGPLVRAVTTNGGVNIKRKT
ncbi:MAG: DUF4097 family beta strand repeat-containing protein [Bryobacteraceae bacterium]